MIGLGATRGGSTSSILAAKAGRAVERLQAQSMQWATRWPCPEPFWDVDPEIPGDTAEAEETSGEAAARRS